MKFSDTQTFLRKYSSVYIFRVAFLFVVYVLVAKATLRINAFTGMEVIIWPAAGISLACILIWGYSVWPALFLAAIVLHLIHGDREITFIGPAIASTLGPMLAANIFSRRGNHNALDRPRDVIRLLTAAFVGGLAGAFFAEPGILLSGYEKMDFINFIQYWVGDSMGMLMAAPLIMVFTSPMQIVKLEWQNLRQSEKIALAVGIAGVILLFTKLNAPIRLYFFFPLILWLALRLGQRGVTVATLVLSNIVIYATAVGLGPFNNPSTKPENEIYFFIFLATFHITGLLVAGVISERETERISKEQAMMLANSELEKTMLALKEAKEAAEASSTAKTAFLANVSHEIRTPLGAILGFSELILTQTVSEQERKKIYEIIKRNGGQLLNVINDILDLSKIEAGKFEMQKVTVLIDDILEDIRSTTDSEAVKKGITLRLTTESNVPKKIYTDPLRLRQILVNVVGNAMKFTDQGSVDIFVKSVIDKDGKNKIAFIVRDTGIGIPSDKVKDLFSPFTQVDFSSTRRFAGTGLGLSLSKRLAMALGGGVELVKTTLGQGSEFKVLIDPGDAVQIELSEKQLKTITMEQQQKNKRLPNLTHKKILLVDDSADNQSLFTYYMKSVGAEVEVANNGIEAIQKVHNGQYDIILMDLQMPEMDGYDATRTLRKEGYKKPIIALSAHAMKAVRERCLASGFDEYISKPIDRKSLVEVLKEFSEGDKSEISH